MTDQEKILKAAMQSPECPAIDDLLSALDGSLEETAAGEIRKHVDSCLACQSEAEVFEDFLTAVANSEQRQDVDWVVARLKQRSAEFEARETRSRGSRWSGWSSSATGGWRMPAAIAAMALLAVVMLQWPGPDPELPSPSGALRSGTVQLLEPRGDQPETPRIWRWQPVEGAHAYLVRFLEVDGRELMLVDSAEPQMGTPPSIAELLSAGRRVLWQVVAQDAGGATINNSSVEAVWVRPGGQ